MASALIKIDGVLRDHSGLPIRDGVEMYSALCTGFRVVLASEDVERDERWLRLEGLRAHQEILGKPDTFLRGSKNLFLVQAETLLGRGEAVNLAFSASPEDVQALMERGLTSCLFAHPKFAHPQFRPDYDHTIKPWDDLVKEIETQSLLAQELPPLDQ